MGRKKIYCLDKTHYENNAKVPLTKSKCRICANERFMKRYHENENIRKKRYENYRAWIEKNPHKRKEFKERQMNTDAYVRNVYGLPKSTSKELIDTCKTLMEFRRTLRKLNKAEKEKQPIQIEQTFEGIENVGNSE